MLEETYGPFSVANRDVDLLPALVNKNGLSRHHTAHVELAWPQEVFGTSWSEQKRNLEAQATALAERECEAFLRTFASRCGTSSTSVSAWSRSVSLVINLYFALKNDFGTAPQADEKRLYTFDLRYEGDGGISPQLRSASAGASRRDSIYRQIRQDCEDVKTVYGNCLLYRVHISTVVAGGDRKPDLSISGYASLATLLSKDRQVPNDWR
ncbi:MULTISPECIES: hypothetical protein [Mesorhizobium]|uniref:hypothetical protein n=1 Tax=Mesorhizobium TaxID=68287 RepID=UPI0010A9780F|nr:MULTISPECIES: hypothetical protein [Mesorhizobium]